MGWAVGGVAAGGGGGCEYGWGVGGWVWAAAPVARARESKRIEIFMTAPLGSSLFARGTAEARNRSGSKRKGNVALFEVRDGARRPGRPRALRRFVTKNSLRIVMPD